MKRGFSLIELTFAIAMMAFASIIVGAFAKDILSYNAASQASMTAQLEGRKLLSVIVSELRSAAPSALGGYLIESASTSTITFFIDVNNDGVSDRVRYYIDPSARAIKRGQVYATGAPPSYNLGTETISTLVSDISNGTSTPLFEYYDKNYTGTSSALSIPVDISLIRLIKVTAYIEKDSNKIPEVTTVSSYAMLRNLKDK